MIDLFIVCIYLIITLSVGFFYGRGVNTMHDFAVSNRSFPTVAMLSTVFATCIGGDDLLGDTERAYSVGVIFLLVSLAQCGNVFCTAQFVAPKIIRDFGDKISIGEIMESLYGKYGRIVCGISNMLFTLGFVAVQISCIGYVCNALLGVSHIYGTIIGSLIVIAYSAFGGIRSVVFTDAVQFGVLIVGIPLIASVVLGQVGGFPGLISKLPPEYLNVGPSNKLFYGYMFTVFAFLFPNFLSVDIQRILMAKDVKQARSSLRWTSALYIPFYVILSIIGLCAYILFPGIEDPNTIFLKVLSESLPVVIRGIAVSAVLAIIMSTADSFLNSAAISAIDDLAPFLYRKKMEDSSKLRLARIITFVFGISSIFITMCSFDSIVEFLLFFFNFWMPVVSAPMLLYIFNFKTDVSTYLVSTIFGFIMLFTYRNFVPEEFEMASQFVGMMATFFGMIILGKFRNRLYPIKSLVK